MNKQENKNNGNNIPSNNLLPISYTQIELENVKKKKKKERHIFLGLLAFCWLIIVLQAMQKSNLVSEIHTMEIEKAVESVKQHAYLDKAFQEGKIRGMREGWYDAIESGRLVLTDEILADKGITAEFLDGMKTRYDITELVHSPDTLSQGY